MDFALPELGEGVYEAELVRWLVQPGDTVRRGQPLLEVLTDKATMEVPSPFAGKITALRGERDELVSREQAEQWAGVTRGPFAYRELPGGHMYLVDEPELVLRVVAESAA